MSQRFAVAVQLKGSAETQRQRVQFSSADWELLLRFDDYAEVLAACVAPDCRVNYRMRWDADEGLEHQWTVPDADRVASLLHYLRPFVLQNEDTHFPRVCNILCRTIVLPGFRKMVDALRRLFLEA